MYETLEVQTDKGVATVWMNRPDVHNAFNAQVIADLTAACGRLDTDDTVRVVVLRTIAEMGKPTIARVHGAALGGGMGLASACDICVASDKAVFATSEVKFGIIPSTIGPYVIRAIGERQACRYFQTAERITAVRAHEIGLAHELVAAEVLDAKVDEIVSALLQGGPKAQAAAKVLIRDIANRTIGDDVVEDTARRIAELRATPEAKEGLDAFLAKRPAAWAPRR